MHVAQKLCWTDTNSSLVPRQSEGVRKSGFSRGRGEKIVALRSHLGRKEGTDNQTRILLLLLFFFPSFGSRRFLPERRKIPSLFPYPPKNLWSHEERKKEGKLFSLPFFYFSGRRNFSSSFSSFSPQIWREKERKGKDDLAPSPSLLCSFGEREKAGKASPLITFSFKGSGEVRGEMSDSGRRKGGKGKGGGGGAGLTFGN